MAAYDTLEARNFKKLFSDRLMAKFNICPEEASDQQVYEILSSIVMEFLKVKRRKFINQVHSAGKKQV